MKHFHYVLCLSEAKGMDIKMKLAIGCDEAAFNLKQEIIEYIRKKYVDIEICDYGTFQGQTALYPDVAWEVAQEVVSGKYDRGILMCGTGIGMAICANKVPGIRAAVCHDPFSAERARKSNDTQIMCIGARIIGSELAKYLVDIWLNSEFSGGNSTRKVQRIEELEGRVI